MSDVSTTVITVETIVNAPIPKVWDYFSGATHIEKWSNASDDWHAPHAENDLRVGGKFLTKMEAKDGGFSFDFTGEYTTVDENKHIAYTLADGRKVNVYFSEHEDGTKVIENFEAEETHGVDQQMSGWQSILDNFKKYVEENG